MSVSEGVQKTKWKGDKLINKLIHYVFHYQTTKIVWEKCYAIK